MFPSGSGVTDGESMIANVPEFASGMTKSKQYVISIEII